MIYRICSNFRLCRTTQRKSGLRPQKDSCRNFGSTKAEDGVEHASGMSHFREVKEVAGKPKKKILPINKTPRGRVASRVKLIVDDSMSSKNDDSAADMMHFVRGGTPFDPVPPPFRLSNYGDNSLYTLVLLRHGESEWNSQNRYTGWCDVNLTEKGRQEARASGRLLKENNIQIDHVFTSVLKRAIFTTNMCLNTAEQHYLPVTKSWRLNERHYGALQGYNKDTAYEELGLDQELVMAMRRSYDTRPPIMLNNHLYWHGNDRRYKDLSKEQLEASRAESLKDAADRILPFYNSHVISSLRAGNKCLIVSHANTIRTLIKHIDNISDEDIKGMTIPTGIPLLYRLDKNMKPVDPNIELEFRYMVEPKGFTWATDQEHGFHGVYLGDLERLQEIQRKRDATNRDWQRIILRNIAKKVNDACVTDAAISNGVLETRQLYFQLDQKMKTKQFGNMLLLVRMKKFLENLMLSRKQMYVTMEAFEGILNKLHLDAEGDVVEPFVAMSCETLREKRSKEWEEIIAQDLEDECLIK